MDKVRTVSDTKRDFYSHHTRPINSIYRRFVEELMVEMHLLTVNVDFRYDPIYALGTFTTFERFMQGYRPESDKDSIFAALCQAVGQQPELYRQQSESLLASAKGKTLSELLTAIQESNLPEGSDLLVGTLHAIAHNAQFKYSRLFAVGLYTILAEADGEIVKDEGKRNQVLQQFSQALNLPPEKLQKDLDLYRSNLDKMDQLLTVLEEALQAERKKREQVGQKPTTNELGKEEYLAS